MAIKLPAPRVVKRLDLPNTLTTLPGMGTPPPLSKYPAAPRPAAPDDDTTPRDGGAMSDGSTAGNYMGNQK
jgi:hypothetical protein